MNRYMAAIAGLMLLWSCGGGEKKVQKPSLLLVTMDTTRADAMGYENPANQTPVLDDIASRAWVFDHAYATVPMTLPSHTSMLTGLYASEHHIHENARYVSEKLELLPQKLQAAGYRTAAFVSAFPLAQAFGLSRGFQVYDDSYPAKATEQRADVVTDKALAYLRQQKDYEKPLFLWVHYFDPHAPYDPPEPFKTQFAKDPYRGEIAFMDQQIGRLMEGFKENTGSRPTHFIIVGDHGEGRGDHGETLHGHLLYNSTIRVPLIVGGQGLQGSKRSEPVSIRRVFNTFLAWAGEKTDYSLANPTEEPVMAEAMKSYLQYGWQPQKMVVFENRKIIQSGNYLVFDTIKDPQELNDLAGVEGIPENCQAWLDEYPLPGMNSTESTAGMEAREKLASLGYVSSDLSLEGRTDAPSAYEMTDLFQLLDEASTRFVQGEYEQVIPLFQKILKRDPRNFMAALRMAVAYSLQGKQEDALNAFKLAGSLKPDSLDYKHYQALHYLRFGKDEQAEPLLSEVLEATPDRLTTLRALAGIKIRKKDISAAIQLLERIPFQEAGARTHLQLAALYMMQNRSEDAVDRFLAARDQQGTDFVRNLDLAVCLMDLGRFEEAKNSLEMVSSDRPGYAMALFKRAQIAALLNEPDAAQRIERAYREGNGTTRDLIQRESLFRGRWQP